VGHGDAVKLSAMICKCIKWRVPQTATSRDAFEDTEKAYSLRRKVGRKRGQPEDDAVAACIFLHAIHRRFRVKHLLDRMHGGSLHKYVKRFMTDPEEFTMNKLKNGRKL